MIFFAQCDIRKINLIRNECVMPLEIKIRSTILNYFQSRYINSSSKILKYPNLKGKEFTKARLNSCGCVIIIILVNMHEPNRVYLVIT